MDNPGIFCGGVCVVVVWGERRRRRRRKVSYIAEYNYRCTMRMNHNYIHLFKHLNGQIGHELCVCGILSLSLTIATQHMNA
jgi:hypothetical protein